MQTMLSRTLTGTVLGVCLALTTAACSDSTTGTGPGAALSQAQADTLGQDLANESDALAEGAVYSSVAGPGINVAPATGVNASPTFSPQCQPTRSPNPPTNSDGDLVPDSVRIDFSGCVISRPLATVTMSGTVDVIDPTPDQTDFAVKTVYTDLTRSVERLLSQRSWSLSENGVRMVSGDSSELHHSETGFTTTFTYNDGSTATHDRTWDATFTADTPGTIARDSLPSGLWHIAGTSSWSRGDRTWSVEVSTDPDLHYNAECTDAPRFDAGTLTAVATRNGASTTVTIAYTGCGAYTVTRS